MIPHRVDITERPEVVDLRSRIGDWEGDTVYGQDAHLVTMVERKSRLTLIGKVDTKQAKVVADTLIDMMKRVQSVSTITFDNGGEFAEHERVAKAINADIVFRQTVCYSSAGNQRKYQWYYSTNLAQEDGSESFDRN